jgi:hypothetical protein
MLLVIFLFWLIQNWGSSENMYWNLIFVKNTLELPPDPKNFFLFSILRISIQFKMKQFLLLNFPFDS